MFLVKFALITFFPQASGADLETGYYRSLEAQFLEVHDGDCDKDFTEYVHSSCEVSQANILISFASRQ